MVREAGMDELKYRLELVVFRPAVQVVVHDAVEEVQVKYFIVLVGSKAEDRI